MLILPADLIHQPLVPGAVFLLLLLQLPSLHDVFGHFPGHSDVEESWLLSPLPDDGVNDFDGLGDGTLHDRTGDRVSGVRIQRRKQSAAFSGVMPFEVQPGGFTGLVVFHSLLQIGDEHIAGFDGNMAEFAEIQGFRDGDIRIGKSGLFQFVIDC